MDGFRAYKFYTAIKLHFTSKSYDVFKHNGHVRGSYDSYLKRNDYNLFERLGRKFKDERIFIQYIASNFMYGNPNMIWEDSEAGQNFQEFIRRRQSMTRVFENDLHTIAASGFGLDRILNFSGQKFPFVLSLHTAGQITIETVSIINDLTNFIDNIADNPFLTVIEQQLMVIKKSKGFVKYDKDKIDKVYQNFIEELTSYNHGTHVPQQQCIAI